MIGSYEDWVTMAIKMRSERDQALDLLESWLSANNDEILARKTRDLLDTIYSRKEV